MNALTAVIYTIKNDAASAAIVGTRVYPDVLPQDTIKPAILVYVASETSEDCLDGFLGFENCTVRVEGYGRSREEADRTIQAARLSLNGLQGVVDGVHIKGVGQNTGVLHLVDKPNDGTDRWQYRSVQSYDVSYNSF